MKDVAANSFLRTLGELRNGSAVDGLNEKFSRLVAEVSQKRRPGELLLKVKVKPNKDGETVAIVAVTKLSLPEVESLDSTFYVSDEGKLSRNDPRQKEMFAALPGGVTEEPVVARAVNG